MDNEELFSESVKSIEAVAATDINIYVDMEKVSSLSSGAFNRLYNLAQLLHQKQAKLFFTDAQPNIEERLSLLTTTE